MSCPNLCHDCETVAHCEKSGCVPKNDGPAPQVLQPLAPSPAERTESVLIDGVAYTIPAAVASEMLRLHMEIQGARLALPGLGNLWCVNVLGPDDVHAMPDRETALVRANELNIAWSQRAHHPNDPMLFAVVVEWPGTAESHAAALSASPQPSMRDPYTDLMAEQAMSINREQLRRALSWMGVSIGDSSDEGFAADISTHVNRLSDAVEAMRQMRSGRASDVPQVPAHIMMAISQYGDARADNNNDELAKALPALIIYIRSALALAERNGEERAPLSEEKRAALCAAFHEQEQQAGFYRVLRRGQHWSVIDGIGNVLRGDELDAAIARRLGVDAAPAAVERAHGIGSSKEGAAA